MKKQLLLLIAVIFTLNIYAQSDYCLRFDGVASRVKYTNDTNLEQLNGATDYTIEAWFYPDDSDIHNRVILKRWNSFAITMYQNNNHRIYFTHYSNNGNDKIFVNSLYNVVNLNQWNHVAVINNSADNTLKIYVNGVDVTADSGGTATTQTALTLDANPGTDANFYVGYGGIGTVPMAYVDKVRVKITAEDIASLNTTDPMGQPYTSNAGTVLLLNFNEGNGTTTVNEANGTDAELQCRGGCAEIPTWHPVQTTMAVADNNTVDFGVYPNPVNNGSVVLNTQNNDRIQQVKIIDVTGKILIYKQFNDTVNQTIIDVQTLKSGIYLVSIKTQNGTGIKKLVIR